jgi:biopolymer transport protein ExbD
MRIQCRSMKKARIEIIPMIDTIFFLFVFFMISTLSMSQYKGVPVNLPKAASGRQAPAESAAITIETIDFSRQTTGRSNRSR